MVHYIIVLLSLILGLAIFYLARRPRSLPRGQPSTKKCREFGAIRDSRTDKCYICPEGYAFQNEDNVIGPYVCGTWKACNDLVPRAFPDPSRPNSLCLQCPNNFYQTTANSCKTDNCTNKYPSGDGSLIFEHWNTGDCYKCQPGYVRTLEPIGSARGCIEGSIFNITGKTHQPIHLGNKLVSAIPSTPRQVRSLLSNSL